MVRSAIRAVRSDNRVLSRYVFNAVPVLQHRRLPAPLAPAAAEVAAQLIESGVAMSNVSSLLGGTEIVDKLVAQAAMLRAQDDGEVDAAKPFLTELLGSAPMLRPEDPLLAVALHPQVKGVAESYCRMRLRVQDVNIWVNQALATGAPTQSQRWHRDLPEDLNIVKCFVYLSDVPDEAGPLQYVIGSNTSEGRKVQLAEEFDGIGHRLSDSDVMATFGAEHIMTARAPAGTMVFADTRGVHRGGFAQQGERVVVQITYASGACTRPRTLRAAPGVDRRQLRDIRLARRW
jgi:hypothetical protein